MDYWKLAVLLFTLVFVAGFSFGYTGSGTDSGGGGDGGDDDNFAFGGGDDFGDGGDKPGDGTGGSDPGTESPGSCYNDVNDDNIGGTDLSDVGCVGPQDVDEIEGLIWDTDLTTTLSGQNPTLSEDESVFFDGFLEMGNDFSSDRSQDSAGSGSLTERNIVDMGSEVGTSYTYAGNSFYSYGRSNSLNYNSFPEGTAFKNDRAIDAPNPGIGISGVSSGDVQGSQNTCGDGIENDAIGKTGQFTPSADSIDCRADYGIVRETFGSQDTSYRESPHEQGSLRCYDDGRGQTDSDVCTDAEDGSCSSSNCGSTCDDGADASCDSSAVNRYGHTGNTYWEDDGEDLRRERCEDDGTDEFVGSSGSDTSCTTGSIVCVGGTPSTPCSDTCQTGGSCTASGGGSDSVSLQLRAWNEDYYSCNDFNTVTGGGESSGDDSALNKPDNDAAATFTDFTSYSGDGKVWCGYDSTLTVDADGPQGNGDGFAVIHDGNVVATESPDGSDSVGQSVLVSEDGSSPSIGRDYTGRIEDQFSCDNGKNTCLAYVDFQTDSSGWSSRTQTQDSAVDSAVEIDTGESQVYTPDESYSVCKNINRINEKNGNGQDELIDCDYERGSSLGDSGDPHDVSPLPEACGDEPNEHLIQMEGPEVDESTVQNNGLAYAQECVDWGEDTGGFGDSLTADACVRNGTVYSEGTVVNIARGDVDGYEEGGDSPDWEVCADVPGEGDELPWDNGEDNQGTDYGGEWHDLDSESVQDYVRGNTGILDDSSGDIGSNGDPNRLSYYWRTNPNPYHSDYNPEGGRDGTALENNCGPNVEGCNDEDNSGTGNKDPTFFAFLNDGEGTYDEDYSPQGGIVSGDVFEENSFFDPAGRLNRLQEDTDQIEPGMDTAFPRLDSTGIWSDSIGGRDEADMFALTESLEWSISNRGVPYAPGSAPYHEDYTGLIRSGPEDATVPKESKVFGNSLAVVAATAFDPVDGPEQVESGEGYWIEPDDIRSENGNYRSNWQDVLNYQLDITGPDAGLGFHTNGMTSTDFYDGGNIVNTDIFFEGEPSTGPATASNTNQYLEPPMCGDDQREYLLEERGETKNSAAFIGRYACADARDHCVQRDYSQKLYNPGSYLQANEAAEDVGRLKQDEEYCAERPSDNFPNWYDQDYGDVDGDGDQETCRENTLYGSQGRRWFSEADVEEHPNAFTGGIDDDSNPDLDNDGVATLTSRPEADSWNDAETPLSSGELVTPNPDRSVATKGFCGGDDESEYLVTQTCETRFCETDNSIIGVAEDPDQCILDQAEVNGVSGDERDLYEQGDTVDVNTGSDVKTIACYDGRWNEEWPVVFLRDSTEVPLGTTDRVSFQVINVQEDAKTFDLELSIGNNDMDSLTTFTDTGTNEMTVDVGGSSSETYSVEIRGNTIIENLKNIELQSESRDGSLEGYDTLKASITNSTVKAVGNQTQERRDIPGIGLTQIAWLVMTTSIIYFFTGRNL